MVENEVKTKHLMLVFELPTVFDNTNVNADLL